MAMNAGHKFIKHVSTKQIAKHRKVLLKGSRLLAKYAALLFDWCSLNI